MKQWLYMLRPVRVEMVTQPTPEEAAAVEQHFQRLKAMLGEGRLILAGRTQEESPFGIVIFEAETEDEAQAIMEGDPAVKAGVMTATLHPYRVALMRGLE